MTVGVAWLSSGPLAMYLVQSGKPYEHLLKKSTLKEQVRHELGSPWRQFKYPHPMMIKDTEQFRLYTKWNDDVSPFIWATDANEDKIDESYVTSCEIYQNDGPYYDSLRGQTYGMITALTFFMGGPYALWLAIPEKIRLNHITDNLTFWYDESDRYVAYMDGSILGYYSKKFVIKPDPFVLALVDRIDKSEKGFLVIDRNEINSLIPKYINKDNANFLFENGYNGNLVLSMGKFNRRNVIDVIRFLENKNKFSCAMMGMNGEVITEESAYITDNSPYEFDRKVFRMSRNESIR